MSSKSSRVKKKKDARIWVFFEYVEKDHSSILRAVATTLAVKERFEISLTDEMRIRNAQNNTKNWWTVEESIADHLYAHTMYHPGNLKWKRYTMNGRAIDGD